MLDNPWRQAMDLEDLTDEEYLGHMRTLFNSFGWKVFIQELKDNVDIIADIQNINSDEELWFSKGKLSAIGQIFGLEDAIERAQAEQDEVLADAGT
jgi:hypothetical protein